MALLEAPPWRAFRIHQLDDVVELRAHATFHAEEIEHGAVLGHDIAERPAGKPGMTVSRCGEMRERVCRKLVRLHCQEWKLEILCQMHGVHPLPTRGLLGRAPALPRTYTTPTQFTLIN